MAAVIEAVRKAECSSVGTGEAYDAYTALCSRVGIRPLTCRAFGDLVAELDIYSLLRSRVLSKGRYGRTRQITLDLPAESVGRIYSETLSSLESSR